MYLKVHLTRITDELTMSCEKGGIKDDRDAFGLSKGRKEMPLT